MSPNYTELYSSFGETSVSIFRREKPWRPRKWKCRFSSKVCKFPVDYMAPHPWRQYFYGHRCKQLVFQLLVLSATEESVNHLPKQRMSLRKGLYSYISAELNIAHCLSHWEEVWLFLSILMTRYLFFISTHSLLTQFQNRFPVNTALLVAQVDYVSSCGLRVELRQNFLRFLHCSAPIKLSRLPHTLSHVRPANETWQSVRSAAALHVWTQSNVIVALAWTGLNKLDANLHAFFSTLDINEWPVSRFFHFRHKEKSPW
jgi:hypothetical protein